jgi:hypothetical protein
VPVEGNSDRKQHCRCKHHRECEPLLLVAGTCRRSERPIDCRIVSVRFDPPACGELHRAAARRVSQRDAIRIAATSPRRARRLASRLQRRASAFGARQQDTGGVPRPAHCRCGRPRRRSKLHPRTLLLTGGKKGLRSFGTSVAGGAEAGAGVTLGRSIRGVVSVTRCAVRASPEGWGPGA